MGVVHTYSFTKRICLSVCCKSVKAVKHPPQTNVHTEVKPIRPAFTEYFLPVEGGEWWWRVGVGKLGRGAQWPNPTTGDDCSKHDASKQHVSIIVAYNYVRFQHVALWQNWLLSMMCQSSPGWLRTSASMTRASTPPSAAPWDPSINWLSSWLRFGGSMTGLVLSLSHPPICCGKMLGSLSGRSVMEGSRCVIEYSEAGVCMVSRRVESVRVVTITEGGCSIHKDSCRSDIYFPWFSNLCSRFKVLQRRAFGTSTGCCELPVTKRLAL